MTIMYFLVFNDTPASGFHLLDIYLPRSNLSGTSLIRLSSSQKPPLPLIRELLPNIPLNASLLNP